jgi:hypothetical protein
VADFYANRVHVESSSTGTGALTLGAAISGAYQSFSVAGVPNGATFPYTAYNATQFECGTGSYNSAGATLARTAANVVAGSGGVGALTNFSSVPRVFIGPLAQTFTTGGGGGPAVNSPPVALVDAATVTPDFGAANNFTWTIGGNRTLANPSNQAAGQQGLIFVKQDTAGGRTLTYGPHWILPGGVGTLSTAPNAMDVINYFVVASGSIYAQVIPWASPNGNRGDITVSGDGATWTINNGAVTSSKIQPVTPVAVASLPAANASGAGARHHVNNANATTFNTIVAGGGANSVPVFSDGTNWRIG